MLPLSHDEVVHGKGSLIGRMPGDEWQRFANLRLLYAYMYTHPGTKLLFMGGEFGQTSQWNHNHSLDWHRINYDHSPGVRKHVISVRRSYTADTTLDSDALDHRGFSWVDYESGEKSFIIYLGQGWDTKNLIVVISNFTPAVWRQYRVGVSS